MLLLVEGGVGSVGARRRGSRRGTRKRERPREPSVREPVRARATDMWLSVALENHLKPLSVYWGPKALLMFVDVATVSVWETSEPPGRYGGVSTV